MIFTKESDIEAVIQENNKRLEEIYQPYNPLVGTEYCEEIKRVRIDIPDAPIPTMYIPIEMEDEPVVRLLRATGSLMKAGKGAFGGAASMRKAYRVWNRFVKARIKHDFEFYFVHQIRIIDKKTRQLVPFVLNRAQRYYLSVLERLRKEGKPIDIILLKARQWGGSTLTQFYMSGIQMNWKMNWNSVVCGDIDNQARKVKGMLARAMDNYDLSVTDGQPVKLEAYQGTTSTQIIKSRGCTISIGSAQHPDSLRCEDLCMAHLTEVGLWKATLSKTPEDLVQSIFSAILTAPYTMKVLESTAKGVGNYFHNTWLDAVDGNNNFTPVFVPWFMIDIYSTDLSDKDKRWFISTMTAEEWELFNLGATIEAICWWRSKSKEYKEKWRFYSEFPSTANQAFQSTGSMYFDKSDVDAMFVDCQDPIFVGDIYGASQIGPDSMDGIELKADEHGPFKIWSYVDKTPMVNRYLVTVDLGKGRTAKADNSVICVFDRYWQTEATGIPEVVAEWCGHLDMDLLSWKAAQVAHYYNDALLVIEDNSLMMSGIDYFQGVLVQIKDYYPNLYKRTIANKVDPAGKARWGWRTDGESKPRICGNLKGAIRDGMYIERCKEALYEFLQFEETEDGKFEAKEGCHDDRVITRAIGVTFLYDRTLMMPPEFYTPDSGARKTNSNNISTYSNL